MCIINGIGVRGPAVARQIWTTYCSVHYYFIYYYYYYFYYSYQYMDLLLLLEYGKQWPVLDSQILAETMECAQKTEQLAKEGRQGSDENAACVLHRRVRLAKPGATSNECRQGFTTQIYLTF